ncbi:protein kinase, ATP binding site-containing protein [Tanacetum coccineum]|uniref:Protein kinase, ATP binding site-containing protein n=1 Tax=Tanacetum coccineum TaxID=301880 RepID=A0ABQ5GY69_9ASTR
MFLKSHDCHIMMQRLLPNGLQNYLHDKIAKPIIELCSLFKQICSATLMEDDMLKAQIKVVDILYDLELIYPLALFDIMIHLVIHLHLEALKGRPIRPRIPEWLGHQIRQRHVDNDKDPEVNTTSELFALACGPTWTPISINSCVVDVDVAWSLGGDGGGEDRPPPHHVPSGCMGCFANRGKGKRNPNLGGRAADRLNTRDKTQNLSLKEITDKKGPTQFDLRPHMESPDWTEINARSSSTLQKRTILTGCFKAQHDEMRRLRLWGQTYTDDEIKSLARMGKARGAHILCMVGYFQHGHSGTSTPVSESADVHEDEDEDGNGDS